jgi:hypothetical protein
MEEKEEENKAIVMPLGARSCSLFSRYRPLLLIRSPPSSRSSTSRFLTSSITSSIFTIYDGPIQSDNFIQSTKPA